MEVFPSRLMWQGIPQLRDHFKCFVFLEDGFLGCVDSPRPFPNKNVQFVLIYVMV